MGRKPAGVRLDSGDLAKDSRWVRRELDRAGWKDVKVFASGDLDESKIAALLAKGAAIDAFGVGTALATPGDAPHLNLIYKLVEVERGGKIREAAKLTRAKATYPGRKQVFRYSAAEWRIQERPDRARKRAGQWRRAAARRSDARWPPHRARGTCQRPARAMHRGTRAAPARYRQINRAAAYPVRYSKR